MSRRSTTRKDGLTPMKLHCHRPALASRLAGGRRRCAVANAQGSAQKRQAASRRRQGNSARDRCRSCRSLRDSRCRNRVGRRNACCRPLGRRPSSASWWKTRSISTVDADAVWIKNDKSEFRLSAQDASEFPPVAEFDDERFYAIPGKSLRDAIKRTAFATDAESSRYALGGVLLELGKDKVTLAATDTRRLAVFEIPCRVSRSASSRTIRRR